MASQYTTMGPIDQYLYDPNLLNSLDFRKSTAKFKPYITAADPGEPWMKVRPLRESDYDKGFLQLLGQLTAVGNVSRIDFLRKFDQMKVKGDYFVTVIEDTRNQSIIGAATLVIEHKFIHDCGLKARLEDVVVNDTYRGKQLGKLITVTVTLLAQQLGCYKMCLECKDKLIPFYSSLGYVLEPGNSNTMQIRYATVNTNHTNGSHNTNSS